MKTSLLKWLLAITLMITAPCLKLYAPPPSAEMVEQQRQEYYMRHLQEKEYKESLQSYVQDVGTKYRYSSMATNFLTEETIDLVVKHCESYPSVVIAMAVIETGWGKYAIGNNYFGIKGKGHIKRTKEWNGSEYITITSSFQYYESMAASIEAHSDLLHSSRYNIGEATTYREATRLVKLGGYATDPAYERKLNFIIEKYELHRLDELKDHYDQYLT